MPGESLRGYGELRTEHHCLDTMSAGYHQPIQTRMCHGEGDTQMWSVLSHHPSFIHQHSLFTLLDALAVSTASMMIDGDGGCRQFSYDGRLIHDDPKGIRYCVAAAGQHAELQRCDAKKQSQKCKCPYHRLD